MKKNFLSLLLMIILFGCGGGDANVGGGGQPVNAATAPVLYDVFLSPSSVKQGANTPIYVTLRYLDPGADLNGGVIFYVIEGVLNMRALSVPDSNTLSFTPSFPIFVQSPVVGSIPIKFYVKDRQGVQSNDKIVYLTQN